MHREQPPEMERILNLWQDGHASVLDVGSFDVNGSFRPLVEDRGWSYTGLDISPGQNVDVVVDDPYQYDLPDGMFDIVISGSTMEHVQDLAKWMGELVRLLRPGGLLALITHTQWRYHPHPVDCWRIMPDGMRWLFDGTGLLHRYEINMYCPTDISASAWKVST